MNPDIAGTEIVIRKIRGGTGCEDTSHQSHVIDETTVPSITGRYMSITLSRLFLNVPLVSSFSGETRKFTLLAAVWENIWDYRMNTVWSGCEKMIDSEGFQHTGETSRYIEFCSMLSPDNGRVVEAHFPSPAPELEAYSKTKGWVWFEETPEDVTPSRFTFQFKVFAPGHTSGWVQDRESFEFILSEHDRVPTQDIQDWKRLGGTPTNAG